MNDTCVIYGNALFDLAREEDQVQEYMRDLTVIRQVLEKTPKFMDMMTSRAIPLTQRLEIIDTCFQEHIQAHLKNFMKILCQNNCIEQLPGCIRQFELHYNDFCGILEVTAVSAVELTPALKEKLEKKLETVTGKTVCLRYRVDAAVLGGIRLELPGKELDGTVRRSLDEIAESLADLTI